MAISRRDFVVGAASVVALCAVGGVAYASSPEDQLLRPPGGQDDSKFLASCVRCDRCRSVCPTNCIDFSHLEDGLANMRAPKLNYHLGYCIFCGKCADVCPTGILSYLDPAVDKIGTAVVLPSQCVAFRSPGSCSRCVEVCPYGAVSLQGQVPVVDSNLCNGCGQCVYECPALIYTSSEATDKRGIEVYAESDVERGEVQ